MRIWFNHWFSTAYNIINMIRSENDVHVICTNKNEYSVVGAACDECYPESLLCGDEYASWCLDFCKEHGIDVFFPRREIYAVSRHKAEFEALGVRVMAEEPEIIDKLSRKDTAYEMLSAAGLDCIPEYHIVHDAEGFRTAYEELSQKYGNVCFKFVRDEGGMSFRLIDNDFCGFSSLFKKSATRITFESALSMLSERESFSSLMVMPYLPDEEISADCLSTSSGMIILPRIKNVSKIERMCYDEKVLALIQRVLDMTGLEWPCNIQFKYYNGKPYFLEVNTRMSGGVQLACAAAGVNIPSVAFNKIIGRDIPWSIDRTEYRITHADTPLVLR